MIKELPEMIFPKPLKYSGRGPLLFAAGKRNAIHIDFRFFYFISIKFVLTATNSVFLLKLVYMFRHCSFFHAKPFVLTSKKKLLITCLIVK